MATRKTGDDLTNAIFSVTREIMAQEGYQAVNFARIARESGTSRTVLYRRWQSPFALMTEAIQDEAHQVQGKLVDADFSTGSLRGDLLEMLTRYKHSADIMGRTYNRAILGEVSKDDNTDVLTFLNQIKQSNLFIMERILSKAQLNGEINNTTTDMVKLLPFELLRYHFLMSDEPITDDFVAELVDDVILPAIMNQQR